jgi:hypothetical protein
MPFLDRVQMTISSASGSAVTLGSVYAANAATMVGAGAVDGAKYSYVISDGNNFELQKQQVYSAGAGTIARGTPVLAFNGTTYSTTQLSTISGSAVFAIDLLAEDLNGFASLDSNGNFSANNLIDGLTSIATAAGTTTLTIASAGIQAFTGTTTQTVKLPTTGVAAGTRYFLINNSTGVVTVQSSGANTIQAMAAGTSAFFTANVATPTTAANWNVNYSSAYLSGGTLSGALNWGPAVTIASASTVNIGAAAGNYVLISGTTTITAFDTIAQGAMRLVEFQGALTLTYNATSLILPGAASITTAAGDTANFISEGAGNWRCLNYSPASGKAVVGSSGGGPTLLTTLTASSSSTLVDTTHLTSAYKSYEFRFLNVVATTGNINPLQMLVSTNGGTSYDSTAANYLVGTSPGSLSAAGVPGMIASGYSPDSTQGISGIFRLYLSQTAQRSMGEGSLVIYTTSTAAAWVICASSYVGSTSVINAVQFSIPTTTIKSGQIEIWGNP